jgi:tetratricopeptide (TPR) repeat protein
LIRNNWLLIAVVIVSLAIQIKNSANRTNNIVDNIILLHSIIPSVRPIALPNLENFSDKAYLQLVYGIKIGNESAVFNALNSNEMNLERRILLAWQLGYALYQQNKFNEAAKAWRYLGTSLSEIEENLLNERIAYEQAGQYIEAERSVRMWVILSEGDPFRYEALGEFYLRWSNSDKAIEAFRQAESVATEAQRDYFEGRIAETEGKWKPAVEMYRRALALGMQNARVGWHLATVLTSKLGEFDQAIQVCQMVVSLVPKDYACYEMLGQIYHYQGKLDEATKWFQDGIQNVGPEQPGYQSLFYVKLGLIDLELNSLDHAKAQFDLAIRLSSYNGDAYQGMATIYARQNNFAEAVQTMQAAVEAQKMRGYKVPAIWYVQLGEYYESLGDIPSAIQAYQLALQADPNELTAQERLTRLSNENK